MRKLKFIYAFITLLSIISLTGCNKKSTEITTAASVPEDYIFTTNENELTKPYDFYIQFIKDYFIRNSIDFDLQSKDEYLEITLKDAQSSDEITKIKNAISTIGAGYLPNQEITVHLINGQDDEIIIFDNIPQEQKDFYYEEFIVSK